MATPGEGVFTAKHKAGAEVSLSSLFASSPQLALQWLKSKLCGAWGEPKAV